MAYPTWEWLASMGKKIGRRDRPFFQALGERVARLRKEHGLTQAQLAEQLGVSQQLVAAYESGERCVPTDTLPRIATALGVSLEELMGTGNGPAKRGPTPKLQRQLEQLSRLPRAKQKVVSEMLEALLQQASR
jgi:transcriptional regulator with XRE-family HTH domain